MFAFSTKDDWSMFAFSTKVVGRMFALRRTNSTQSQSDAIIVRCTPSGPRPTRRGSTRSGTSSEVARDKGGC